jgi:hypothetical protein
MSWRRSTLSLSTAHALPNLLAFSSPSAIILRTRAPEMSNISLTSVTVKMFILFFLSAGIAPGFGGGLGGIAPARVIVRVCGIFLDRPCIYSI